MHKRGFNRRMGGQKKRRYTHWNRPREKGEEVTHRHFHWTAAERRELEQRAAIHEWIDNMVRLPKKAKLALGGLFLLFVALLFLVYNNNRSYLLGFGLVITCVGFFVLGSRWKAVRDFGKNGVSMSRRRFFVLLLAAFLLGAFAISAIFILYTIWAIFSTFPDASSFPPNTDVVFQ